MNNTNTKLSKISLRLKVTANAIILIISGFMTVCDQMPKFDPVTFEYIGQAYFWKNPLAIYWYVFFPSAITPWPEDIGILVEVCQRCGQKILKFWSK